VIRGTKRRCGEGGRPFAASVKAKPAVLSQHLTPTASGLFIFVMGRRTTIPKKEDALPQKATRPSLRCYRSLAAYCSSAIYFPRNGDVLICGEGGRPSAESVKAKPSVLSQLCRLLLQGYLLS